MKVLRFFALLLLLPVVPALAAEKLEDLANPGFHEPPAWFKTSFLDLGEDVEEAREEGKRVLLYFYQDGCPYCKKLLTVNFSQQAIVDKTRRHFDVIAINMWGDREVTDLSGRAITEKQFAVDMRVMFTPTLIFLDTDGSKALRVNGYYHPNKFSTTLDYVAGGHFGKMRYRQYLKDNIPPATHGKLHKQDFFLSPPYKLNGLSSDKPLLVLFEQKDCPACDELHTDILRREESRKLIDQFDVVQLDMWSKTPVTTPDGRVTTAQEWARKLDIQYAPSMVFFAGDKEVFRAEAYLKAFHVQSSLDYVSTASYKRLPSFQRFVEERADHLREQGVEVELMR